MALPILKAMQSIAPQPPRQTSRAAQLYAILDTLGGRATLRQINKLIPASDVPRPKNLAQLRNWISSSCTSKGYFTQIERDLYRISTHAEFLAIKKHNRAVGQQWAKKQKTTKNIMPPRAPTPKKPVKRPVVKPQQPVPRVDLPRNSFSYHYVASVLGTASALSLAYVLMQTVS